MLSECGRRTWIGYKITNGLWQWSDGGQTNPETTEWAPNQPNNTGGNENCAEIQKIAGGKFLLNDANCARKRNYLCEVDL